MVRSPCMIYLRVIIGRHFPTDLYKLKRRLLPTIFIFFNPKFSYTHGVICYVETNILTFISNIHKNFSWLVSPAKTYKSRVTIKTTELLKHTALKILFDKYKGTEIFNLKFKIDLKSIRCLCSH